MSYRRRLTAEEAAILEAGVATASHTHEGGGHTHVESDVTSLVTDLAGKAASGHNHDAAYSATGHTHTHASLTSVTADQHHAQAHVLAGADHTASGLTIGHVVRASGATTFAWSAIQDADLPSTIARDSEVTSAVSAHEGAADPHTGYQQESEKAQANGYASLDAGTKVPTAQLGGAGADGTKFLRGDQTWQVVSGGVDAAVRMMNPISWMGAANLTTASALVTNTSYFLYIGRAGKALTTIDVVVVVATAAATITWAEVGIFKGTLVANGAATSLTRLGFTNVAATFNGTGIKKTTVSLSGHAAADDLWVAFGSQATTPYQLRAGLAYHLQDGGFQSVAARISTMNPSTGTNVAAALAVPWVQVVFS